LIDIQLVSSDDFVDKKNLLPSTVPKPSLAKRISPIIESKGQLFTEPVFVVRAGSRESGKQNNEEAKEATQKQQIPYVNVLGSSSQDLASRCVPMNVPVSFSNQYSVKNLAAKKTGKAETPVEMEEVKPPELLEVKENEGDNSYNYWQEGGRSDKGTGASTSLTEYLKDLHRKLKHAWLPPAGTVHHIKVIFRLTREGGLVSIKLTQSSGNKVADDSAFLAVKESAPFGKLPADYTHQFLDLAYTFNYTTDELKEIK
jgi:hypothetical protein